MNNPVVILAGGLGTRLREETEFRPKPMVPIGGRPILWHIMKLYAHHGRTGFIICLGYKGEMIREFFFDYRHTSGDVMIDMRTQEVQTLRTDAGNPDWRVILADTGQATMTGGRIRRIRDYVEGDWFCMTYGDGVADVDVTALLATHRRMGRTATVTAVRPPSRFGELIVDGGLVTCFQEKEPLRAEWINGGFFVFSPKIFDYLDGDECILEREPMHRLVAEGQLAVHHHEGHWQCMDTVRDMEMLNGLWATGKAPWKVWTD
ncbi:MAG: glucose-1-phosphate cytidylyltransferase [Candidatus Sumerlaeia bacterium]|nr:glucose-1-phosphate cytidylyltransferase [Candidatus Sumerlaeia bacterium]